jgi:hypothetical protein
MFRTAWGVALLTSICSQAAKILVDEPPREAFGSAPSLLALS